MESFIVTHAKEVGLAWPSLQHHYVVELENGCGHRWHRSSIGPAWVLGAKPAPVTSNLVLCWRLDQKKNRILFHCPGHEALAGWARTASGLYPLVGETNVDQTIGVIAEACAFIEARIFRMEGNWLLKRRNQPLTGLLRHFLFWLAYKQLAETPLVAGRLLHCMERIAPEVDLALFDGSSNSEVMAACVQHFFLGRNDLIACWKTLKERP